MFGFWIFFASCSLGLVYGKIPMEKNPQKYINSPRDVMYVVFDRIIWAAAVFFVLFACETVYNFTILPRRPDLSKKTIAGLNTYFSLR